MKTRIALLGQPNSGKSTVYNALTGSRQHVGNWPGKTVEKNDGFYTYKGTRYTVTDLPGSYSISWGLAPLRYIHLSAGFFALGAFSSTELSILSFNLLTISIIIVLLAHPT